MRIVFTLLSILALISISSAAEISYAEVYYNLNSTKVIFHFNLSPFEMIIVVLFGAENLKHMVEDMLNSSNFTIISVTFDRAVVEFQNKFLDGYAVFERVYLNSTINLKLHSQYGDFWLINTSYIPENIIPYKI